MASCMTGNSELENDNVTSGAVRRAAAPLSGAIPVAGWLPAPERVRSATSHHPPEHHATRRVMPDVSGSLSMTAPERSRHLTPRDALVVVCYCADTVCDPS